MDTKKFAENLRDARLRAGYSLRDLATLVGLSAGYIQKIETDYPGAVAGLRMDNATRLAGACGVTLDTLTGVPPQGSGLCQLAGRLPADRQKDLENIAKVFLVDSKEQEDGPTLESILAADGLFHRGVIGGLLPSLLGLNAKQLDPVNGVLDGCEINSK